jgi:hypothetical protein
MKRWIPLSGLSPPHFRACLKSLPRYPSVYAVVISVLRSLRMSGSGLIQISGLFKVRFIQISDLFKVRSIHISGLFKVRFIQIYGLFQGSV